MFFGNDANVPDSKCQSNYLAFGEATVSDLVSMRNCRSFPYSKPRLWLDDLAQQKDKKPGSMSSSAIWSFIGTAYAYECWWWCPASLKPPLRFGIIFTVPIRSPCLLAFLNGCSPAWYIYVESERWRFLPVIRGIKDSVLHAGRMSSIYFWGVGQIYHIMQSCH